MKLQFFILLPHVSWECSCKGSLHNIPSISSSSCTYDVMLRTYWWLPSIFIWCNIETEQLRGNFRNHLDFYVLFSKKSIPFYRRSQLEIWAENPFFKPTARFKFPPISHISIFIQLNLMSSQAKERKLSNQIIHNRMLSI